ncbi:hypothetical protein ACP70R_036046 [Stipagrostis hirtigluma subsp. patula]
MDLENDAGGQPAGPGPGVVAGGDLALATAPEPGDYLGRTELVVLRSVAVVMTSFGALLIVVAFTDPKTRRDRAGFAAELACGAVALAVGCTFAAWLAVRLCCR